VRIFAIGGEPATGKSTLVKSILAELEPSHAFCFGRLKGHVIRPLNLWVLGIYNPDEKFPGTDRLSMSVQPDAVAFLRKLKETNGKFLEILQKMGEPGEAAYTPPTVLFEGDRLVNGKFLRECANYGFFHFLVLTAGRATKDKRHEARKDTQSLEFLTGRATKTKNLIAEFQPRTWINETPEDSINCRNWLIAKLKQIGS
jgi:hypothetical protein